MELSEKRNREIVISHNESTVRSGETQMSG